MYSDVDYCRHKTVLSQFKNLTRLFILSTSIISSFAFASDLAPPKDYRADSIINDVKNSKYSSATGKNYTVGGVSSNNGTVSARVDQRVVVGGSSAEVKTKVSFPVDYKDLAKKAGKLARGAGGLYLADKAFQGLMDGVDYVLDPNNNTIQKPNPAATDTDPSSPSNPTIYYNNQHRNLVATTPEGVCKLSGYTFKRDGSWLWCVAGNGGRDQVQAKPNPAYNPSAPKPPSHVPASQAEVEDAFYKWMINNPTSVTDPVTTYIYSPKSTQTGQAQPSSADPSFGPNEITDEMMDNYIRNRDLALNKPGSYEIGDSTRPDPAKDPENTVKEETLPDGSKKKTETKIETLPDGSTKKTVKETITTPDGKSETKTSVEESSPQIPAKLPAACEYFATLCDWMNWTKENTETPEDNDIPKIEKIDVGQLDTGTFKATAGCPSPIRVPVSFGKGGNVEISYEPLCQFATKWSFVAPLIGFLSGAMIIVGVGRKGEDSEL